MAKKNKNPGNNPYHNYPASSTPYPYQEQIPTQYNSAPHYPRYSRDNVYSNGYPPAPEPHYDPAAEYTHYQPSASNPYSPYQEYPQYPDQYPAEEKPKSHLGVYLAIMITVIIVLAVGITTIALLPTKSTGPQEVSPVTVTTVISEQEHANAPIHHPKPVPQVIPRRAVPQQPAPQYRPPITSTPAQQYYPPAGSAKQSVTNFNCQNLSTSDFTSAGLPPMTASGSSSAMFCSFKSVTGFTFLNIFHYTFGNADSYRNTLIQTYSRNWNYNITPVTVNGHPGYFFIATLRSNPSTASTTTYLVLSQSAGSVGYLSAGFIGGNYPSQLSALFQRVLA